MLDDAQVTTLRLLGHTWWRMGSLDKAERLFKALLSLRPGDGQCLRQLAALCLADGRPGESLEYLGRLTSDSYDQTDWLMRAQALWRLDREAEAKAAFQKYLGTAAVVERSL